MAAAPTDLPKDVPEPHIEIGNARAGIVLGETSGRLLGVYNRATGTEYLSESPSVRDLRYELAIVARTPEGAFVTVLPPAQAAAVKRTDGDGAQTATIVYDQLEGPNGPLAVRATIHIRVPTEGEETIWSLELENRSQATIHEVLFPRITGVTLGSDPATTELIYPYHAGERTRNPAVEYAGPEFLVGTARNGVSLQDVPLSVQAGGGSRPVYVRECNYLGSASMQWMDYHNGAQGLYVASYDETALVTGLRVETGGPAAPPDATPDATPDETWMGFGFRKHLAIRPGETWASRPYAVGIHQGDWHWAADRYREWAITVMQFPTPPRWFLDDPIVNPHYDFKSQTGTVGHRFRDVPAVYERARQHGMNHLLFAGWNRMGFDAAYAEYFPDMELGTQVELRDACRAVVAQGGKITFYINCRIFNTGSEYRASIIEQAACRDRDGHLYEEEYGTQRFAVMCPDTETWRQLMGDFAYWMVDVYGATGVYLDQIGSAPAVPCYAENHGHAAPGTFNQGYLTLMQDVYRRVKGQDPDTFLMIENCGDTYGQYVDAHLTWMPSLDAGKRDRYWAVFKYAFPECVQVNMYPRPGAPDAEQALHRSILTGSAFWRHAEQNELPPDVYEAMRFRRAVNHVLAYGRFKDTVGLTFGTGVEATRFDLAPRGTGRSTDRIDTDHTPGIGSTTGAQSVVLLLTWNRTADEQPVDVELDGTPLAVRRLVLGDGRTDWEPLTDVGTVAAGERLRVLRVMAPAGRLSAVEITCRL